jgi:serine O-acetyltransferase
MNNMKEAGFLYDLFERKKELAASLPDKLAAETFIDDVFQFLFIRSRAETDLKRFEAAYKRLHGNFTLLLLAVTDEAEADRQADVFFQALPAVYNSLLKDAQAILDFDPAAQSIAEVVTAYPGFYTTVVYRLSHQLGKQGVKLLPRLFTEYAHSKTGIDIHPSAKIGSAFAIDHGTGIVVGETTIIGNNVKLYQGVTLGALNIAKSLATSKRHPTIKDGVVIYAGATILGGETVIGEGSIIGGNVWLTHSVPPNSVVYHQSEVRIKDQNPFPERVNLVM